MKETTADRLRQIMKLRNLRQVDILEKCKPYCEKYNIRLAKNDLSQYVSGRNEPNSQRLGILAMALQVTEAWLAGYDVPMTNAENIIPIETRKYPLLGEVACGIPRYADEHIELYVEHGTKIQADFCVRAKGDSMINAGIHDGDIVFVRKQPTVDNHDIAVVLIGDEATLKRVFFYPEQQKLVLQAENPDYEPFVYVGEELQNVQILGKAVAYQSDVK